MINAMISLNNILFVFLFPFSVNLREEDKVNLSHFDLIQVLGTGGTFIRMLHSSIFLTNAKKS